MNINKRTGVVLSVFVVGLLSSILFLRIWGNPVSAEEDYYEDLKVFTEVLSAVQRNYVEPVKNKELVTGAIHGMLGTLDPHSSHMSADIYKESQIDTKGEFGGLGLQVGANSENRVVVIAPIEGTPADRAGILAGDIILKVDDQTLTKEIGLLEAVHKMRGAKGTKVTLTIQREGEETPRIFELVREMIRVQSVKSKVLDGEIGYVRITQFQEQTGRDLSNALSTLKAARVHSMVLDLRNNPGGLLTASVEVAEQFLEKGKLIVFIKGRDETKTDFVGKGKGDWEGVPLVILVNKGSASASEIVAGALQDYGRAVILGTQTFGKGSVQTILPLSDGSALRLTTAKYYTPKGRSIQDEGVTPDIVVKPQTEKPAQAQLPETPKKDDPAEPTRKEMKKPKTEKETTGALSPGEENDIQLQKAIDLLKGWKIFKGIDAASNPVSMAENNNPIKNQ